MVNWLQQTMLRPFVFMFSIHRLQVVGRLRCISDLLNQSVRIGWRVNKTFSCESVGESLNGLNIKGDL